MNPSQLNKSDNPPLLEVHKLRKYFPVRSGLLQRQTGSVKAVDEISFELGQGQTLGIVGESGCGKSTLGRSLIRLYEPTSGQIRFRGKDWLKLNKKALRTERKHFQMIFQDPFSSLDPRMTVGQIIKEPFKVHGIGSNAEQNQWTGELLEKVGLKPIHAKRYPHEFSGGQRQRLAIARTIALKPQLVIADEPVSALDVSIQAQILNLMQDLQDELGLTYLFISHDLAVVEHLCDHIAVMYLGRIVDIAPRDKLFSRKAHPYTRALIQAIPEVGKGRKKDKVSLQGEVPSPLNPPAGCHFHPRCIQATEICRNETPPLRNLSNDTQHQSACWLNS